MKILFLSTILALAAAPTYAGVASASQPAVAAASEPAKASETPAKTTSSVVIQSGAFNNDEFAVHQAARVSLLGVPSKVVSLKDATGSTTVHVVRSYRMSRPEAEKMVSRLRKNDVQVMLLSN